MSTLVFANNASATLAGAITNTSTTINLQAGEGALFPTLTAGQYFVGTLVDAATGLLNEIVWCTARSGDVLTVARAQEGTTGLAWNAGDFFSNLWTAGQAAEMLQQNQVPSSITYFGVDTGTVNAIIATVSPSLSSLANGNIFEIQTAYANTSAAVVMNISSTGNYNCYRSDGTALKVGDIQGPPFTAQFSYNAAGTKYLLLNPATWQTAPFSKFFQSSGQPIPAGGYASVAHGLGATPKGFDVLMLCTSNDSSYTAGDVVSFRWLEGQYTGVSLWANATDVGISYIVGIEGFGIIEKTTISFVVINTSNWNLIFSAWI
jgi:hypothetical protein